MIWIKKLQEWINFALNPCKNYNLYHLKIHYLNLYKIFKISFKDYKLISKEFNTKDLEEIKSLRNILLRDLDNLKSIKVISDKDYYKYLAQL